MDPFSLPVDPLLNLQNSLDYLNQPALESGSGASSSANVPLPELDYSYWLNATPVAPFESHVPSTSLSSEAIPSSTPLRGATPLNATGRNVPSHQGSSRVASSLSSGGGMQGGSDLGTSGPLDLLLPSTSGQAHFGGGQHVDLFPSSFTESLAQASRQYTNHQGDIPVDGYGSIPLHLPASATKPQPFQAQQHPPRASGSQLTPAPFATSSKASGSSVAQASGRQQQADESVPEAALHLLRLALPSGSNGSVSTNATLEEDAHFDQDGDGGSAATSVSSNLGDSKGKGRAVPGKGRQSQAGPGGQFGEKNLRSWQHADGEPPLQLDVGAAPRAGSGRASGTSASGRSRQHRPARDQREQTASTRAGSENGGLDTPEEGGRRKSGRVRKTILPSPALHFGDSDASSGEDDDVVESELEVDDSDSDADINGKTKGKGKGKGKGKAKVEDASVSGSATKLKAKVKRASEGNPNPTPAKKPRTSGEAPPPPRRPRRAPASLNHLVNRTLPPGVPIDPAFARFYRAFPLSAAFPPDSYVHTIPRPPPAPRPNAPVAPVASTSAAPFQQIGNMAIDPFLPGLDHQPFASTSAAARSGEDAASASGSTVKSESQDDAEDDGYKWFLEPPADGAWNKGTVPFNLYTPKFVKGNAVQKCGMCPICIEPVARGGSREQKWLKLKNSSYVYHMSHAHGISNITGLPFSPPKEMRAVPLNATSKDAREIMREGLCHKCNQWIALDSTKNLEALVPELFWFKHAKKCHHDSRMAGDTDCFVKDSVYRLALFAAKATGATYM